MEHYSLEPNHVSSVEDEKSLFNLSPSHSTIVTYNNVLENAVHVKPTTLEIAKLLLRFGFSPIPILPKKNDGSKSDGKKPGYIDAEGKIQPCYHKQYQETQPGLGELKEWFSNPQIGIGCLGNHEFTWIDIDLKTFDYSQQDCDSAYNQLLNEFPQLKTSWLEKTRSGGYRLLVRFKGKTFTNFGYKDKNHVGELIGHGRYAVLAPTVDYTNLNLPSSVEDVPVFEKPEDLGFYNHSSNTEQLTLDDAPINEPDPTTEEFREKLSEIFDLSTNYEQYRLSFDLNNSVFLGDLLAPKFQELLCKQSKVDEGKRSDLLTVFTYEVFGWKNIIDELEFSDKVLGGIETLILIASQNLNYDLNRLDSFKKGLKQWKLTSAKPSLYLANKKKGNDGLKACESYIKWMLGVDDPYKVTNNFTIEQALTRISFNLGYFTVNGTFYKDTGFGFSKKVQDDEMRKIIGRELAKFYEQKATKDGIIELYKFSTTKRIKDCLQYVSDELSINNEIANPDHLICFKNGTLNILSNELQPHSYEDFLTFAIDADYTNTGTLTEHLNNFFTRQYGAEMMPIVQAFIRYLIDPLMPPGKFVHLIGGSRTGKGLLIRLLASLFDSSCVRTLPDLDILNSDEKKYQYLQGSKFCYVPDMIKFSREPQAFYEAVDRGEGSARKLHSSDVNILKCKARFAIASVGMPQTASSSTGWGERVIIVPTLGATVDRLFSDKSLQTPENKSALISWGLAMSRENAIEILWSCTQTNERIRKLKEDHDLINNPIRAFFDECIRTSDDDNATITREKLYSYYEAWCTTNNYKAKGKLNFFEALRSDEIISKFFVDVDKKKIDGKTVHVPAHFKNLEPLKDVFIDASDINKLKALCDPYKCSEGNFQQIREFFNPKRIKEILKNELTQIEQTQEEVENEAINIASKLIGYLCNNDEKNFKKLCQQISRVNIQIALNEIMKEHSINIDFNNLESLKLPDF